LVTRIKIAPPSACLLAGFADLADHTVATVNDGAGCLLYKPFGATKPDCGRHQCD
jgi:hypothetical protein